MQYEKCRGSGDIGGGRPPLSTSPLALIAQADSVARSYEIALYWMMTCLSTVGFGDIHPQRTETRLFSLVVMLFSIVMNLYILTAGLAPALQESFMNQSMNQKKGKLAAVLDFYKVPWTLRKQVYTVYPFVLESAMYDMQEIAELPKYLQVCPAPVHHPSYCVSAGTACPSGCPTPAAALSLCCCSYTHQCDPGTASLVIPPRPFRPREVRVVACPFSMIAAVQVRPSHILCAFWRMPRKCDAGACGGRGPSGPWGWVGVGGGVRTMGQEGDSWIVILLQFLGCAPSAAW